MPCTQTMNKWTKIKAVTKTGSMNTCKKYILVTVWPDKVEPANKMFAIHSPINGVDVAMFIPIVAAPNAKLSHGNRYPE